MREHLKGVSLPMPVEINYPGYFLAIRNTQQEWFTRLNDNLSPFILPELKCVQAHFDSGFERDAGGFIDYSLVFNHSTWDKTFIFDKEGRLDQVSIYHFVFDCHPYHPTSYNYLSTARYVLISRNNAGKLEVAGMTIEEELESFWQEEFKQIIRPRLGRLKDLVGTEE